MFLLTYNLSLVVAVVSLLLRIGLLVVLLLLVISLVLLIIVLLNVPHQLLIVFLVAFRVFSVKLCRHLIGPVFRLSVVVTFLLNNLNLWFF